MNKLNSNQRYEANAKTHFGNCSNKDKSQKFGQNIKRFDATASNQNGAKNSHTTHSDKQSSITKSAHSHLSNSSGYQSVQMDVQINKFALQTITQIIGLISKLLDSLGLGSNGLDNISYETGDSNQTGTGSGTTQNGGNHVDNGGTHTGYSHVNGGSHSGNGHNSGGYQDAGSHTGGGYGGDFNAGGGLGGGYGSQPTQPQNPDPAPVHPETPPTPETPEHPGTPQTPTTPENPGTPETPETPETPTPPTPQEVPKAGDAQIRLGPIDEASKTGELSGKDRPNPREISNTVAEQHGLTTSNDNNASDMLWSWGQFIDHDMVLTKEGEEKANIAVPRGDRNFDPTHTGGAFVPFTRSDATVDADGNRTQINEQTALIDGSMVYGATAEETASLRSNEGGKLKIDENGHLLPKDRGVLAGDPRAAEQPGLLSLQTLFAREHNRQADIVAQKNPTWSDDKIFSEAQRIVGNQIQAITYNEFLPTLLGSEAPSGAKTTYDPTVNGQVSSEFATAAFRLGHTMVNSTVAYKNEGGSLEQASLGEVFFRPDFTQKNGIGSILSGQSEQKAQAVDPYIVDELRNQLLGSPDQAGPRLDLATLNVQRGRDHNIPSYNEMREALGMSKITSFNDPIFQDGVGEKLAAVYGSPDEIDLWVGGLSENAQGSSMLGETFTNIVAEQFYRTAAADQNFYSNTATAEERAYLNDLTLSDIIRANSDNTNIDDTAFIVG